MPSPLDIARETLEQLQQALPALNDLDDAKRRLAEGILHRGVVRQLLRDIWEIDNCSGDPREALLQLLDADAITTDAGGAPVQANTATRHWREWYPGLSNGDLTLGEVLDSLPGFSADQVPALVRLFENPASPVALVGACTLAQHDAIHVLLGRGLVDQDEAFVIGFTAGAATGLTDHHVEAYRVGLSSYAEPYTIKGRDLLAFDLGVQAGRTSPARDLHALDVEPLRDTPLAELRDTLGLDLDALRGFYRLEQRVISGTPASLRLPTG